MGAEMTRDDIIRMARECGLTINDQPMLGVEHFANLVAAAEREACAEICDKWMPWTNPSAIGEVKRVAAAIRARGE